jgi:hypothetical protein
MGLLDMYPFGNIRRNHGFEHATIHVLSEKYPNLSIVGRSDLSGYTLYGQVSTEDIREAAHEALRRLRAGQSELAVHPRCGTVLATTGVLTGMSAFMAVSLTGSPNKRFRWVAIPETILAATIATLMAQPLGMLIQEKYTVSGIPQNLEIVEITQTSNGSVPIHRISTRQ